MIYIINSSSNETSRNNKDLNDNTHKLITTSRLMYVLCHYKTCNPKEHKMDFKITEMHSYIDSSVLNRFLLSSHQ